MSGLRRDYTKGADDTKTNNVDRLKQLQGLSNSVVTNQTRDSDSAAGFADSKVAATSTVASTATSNRNNPFTPEEIQALRRGRQEEASQGRFEDLMSSTGNRDRAMLSNNLAARMSTTSHPQGQGRHSGISNNVPSNEQQIVDEILLLRQQRRQQQQQQNLQQGTAQSASAAYPDRLLKAMEQSNQGLGLAASSNSTTASLLREDQKRRQLLLHQQQQQLQDECRLLELAQLRQREQLTLRQLRQGSLPLSGSTADGAMGKSNDPSRITDRNAPSATALRQLQQQHREVDEVWMLRQRLKDQRDLRELERGQEGLGRPSAMGSLLRDSRQNNSALEELREMQLREQLLKREQGVAALQQQSVLGGQMLGATAGNDNAQDLLRLQRERQMQLGDAPSVAAAKHQEEELLLLQAASRSRLQSASAKSATGNNDIQQQARKLLQARQEVERLRQLRSSIRPSDVSDLAVSGLNPQGLLGKQYNDDPELKRAITDHDRITAEIHHLQQTLAARRNASGEMNTGRSPVTSLLAATNCDTKKRLAGIDTSVLGPKTKRRAGMISDQRSPHNTALATPSRKDLVFAQLQQRSGDRSSNDKMKSESMVKPASKPAPNLPPPPVHPPDRKPKRMVLATQLDKHQLSQYQKLLRQHIVVFESTRIDVDYGVQGRRNPPKLGTVGIACKFCESLPLGERGRAAVYYPTNIKSLYQVAHNMGSNHMIHTCKKIPENMRLNFERLRDLRETSVGGRRYWEAGCRECGLMDTDDGIRFKS